MRQHFDKVIYLLLVGILGVFLAKEWPRQEVPPSSVATVTNPPAENQVSAVGATYAAIIWIGLPAVGFLIVNIRASRRFKNRLGQSASRVEESEAAVPTVRAKSSSVEEPASKP